MKRQCEKQIGLCWMTKFFLLAIPMLFMAAPWACAACRPIPRAAQLWSQSAVRWVWVGEVHGTTETPAVFGDLVCNALARGLHVTVALERPKTEQAAIDLVVSSGDRHNAEQRLLNQPDWKDELDGRTSKAMLELLLQLRELKVQYPGLRVATIIDPYAYTSSEQANEAMGHAVLALGRKQPNDLVLVLTGNVHGLKNPIFGYKTAAMYLPTNQLISLQVTDAGGGHAWNLVDEACGERSRGGVPDKDKSRPFGVYLDPALARVGTVDGILTLGKPTTVSVPANAAASANAPCRKKFLSQQEGSQGR